MKVAIMQPYFLPYIGYWQLLHSVHLFVIYDEIEYTKKGWINRNRMLLNRKESLFTIPLKKDSDYKYIVEREISDDFNINKFKNQINAAYLKAPYFTDIYSLFERIINYHDKNLFNYILNSLNLINEYLGLKPEIILYSSLSIDNSLKGEDKVISICKKLDAKTYINAIGGQELYSKERFLEKGIDLKFIKSNQIQYKQFDNEFVPWLSILDILMFNSKARIKEMLNEYTLI